MELFPFFDLVGTAASALHSMLSRLLSKFITSPEDHKSKLPTRNPRPLGSQPIPWGGQPPRIVFILGPPGAGKETHSKRLRRDFPGLTHLSYGDMLRYQAAIPASWVSTFPRRGGGVEGDPVLSAVDAVRLLRETIEAGVARGQRIWLIDGFPRTREHMDAWADAQMPRASRTLFLECDASALVARILGRAETSGRPGDADIESVRERVKRNMDASEAMLQALRDCDVPIVKINANRDLEVVYKDIYEHFKGITVEGDDI
ncbi:P-loop containing nucleoside triphosphate hydrolase protein [Nemania sp. FL0031]|nr:P-loop containing nucleoside triphosphate hydrolase protein [Nemania sp. FL0031]